MGILSITAVLSKQSYKRCTLSGNFGRVRDFSQGLCLLISAKLPENFRDYLNGTGQGQNSDKDQGATGTQRTQDYEGCSSSEVKNNMGEVSGSSFAEDGSQVNEAQRK